MKKVFKVGVIVLILGVILLGIGFFNNGNKAVYFENNRPAIFHLLFPPCLHFCINELSKVRNPLNNNSD